MLSGHGSGCGANMVAFLAENGKGVPEEIILGAMVYSSLGSGTTTMGRLLPFCARSENKETRFIAHCYERAAILTNDRKSKEANDIALMLKEAEEIDFSNPLAVMGVEFVGATLDDDWNEEIFGLYDRILKNCRNSIPRGEMLLTFATMAMASSGDFAKAKEIMAQAEEMDPERKSLNFQMRLQMTVSFLEDKAGNQTEALAKLERLAERMERMLDWGDSGNSSRMGLNSLLSDICYKQGLPEKKKIYAQRSIEAYEKLAERERNDAEALWRLAQAYRRMGQLENALEANYRMMRSLRGYDRLSVLVLHAWDQRGAIFYELGMYKQSLQALKQCMERMNESEQADPFGRVTAYFQIAQTLDAMKKKAQEYIDAILEDYKTLRQYGFVLQEDLRHMLAYVHEEEQENLCTEHCDAEQE